MPRARRGTTSVRRHKKVLKLAKGYRGAKSRTFRAAREQVLHSLSYSYRDRRRRKRDFRRLWITRINAATRARGLTYSQFVKGLAVAEVDLNRKMLAEMAIHDPHSFDVIIEKAKNALKAS